MNHSATDSLELKLISELRRIEGAYRRALAMIRTSLPERDPSAEQISAFLCQFQPVMRQLQEMENSLAPLRKQWLAQSRRPGAELIGTLRVHEQLLGELLSRIDGFERELQRARKALLPAVDNCVRHQQMQRAYQHAAR